MEQIQGLDKDDGNTSCGGFKNFKDSDSFAIKNGILVYKTKCKNGAQIVMNNTPVDLMMSYEFYKAPPQETVIYKSSPKTLLQLPSVIPQKTWDYLEKHKSSNPSNVYFTKNNKRRNSQKNNPRVTSYNNHYNNTDYDYNDYYDDGDYYYAQNDYIYFYDDYDDDYYDDYNYRYDGYF